MKNYVMVAIIKDKKLLLFDCGGTWNLPAEIFDNTYDTCLRALFNLIDREFESDLLNLKLYEERDLLLAEGKAKLYVYVLNVDKGENFKLKGIKDSYYWLGGEDDYDWFGINDMEDIKITPRLKDIVKALIKDEYL